MARAAAAARPSRAPETRTRPRSRPVVVQRQSRRRRLRRLRLGLATIPLVAVLFVGVVYVNSAQLGVTKTQGAVIRQTIAVQEQITSLQARQARRDLIVRNRAVGLGLVRPSTDDLHFVQARPLVKP